jgi:hypothetical protein
MKFSERMQTYASAVVVEEDWIEKSMKYLALYILEMHMEDLVDGEAYAWDDVFIPEPFLGKDVSLEEQGVHFFFLTDGKVCVETI